MKKDNLYPGSDEAVLEGCTCDPIVNRLGEGVLGGGWKRKAKKERNFLINLSCPLHANMTEELIDHVQAE